jgi:hypothetical protein
MHPKEIQKILNRMTGTTKMSREVHSININDTHHVLVCKLGFIDLA